MKELSDLFFFQRKNFLESKSISRLVKQALITCVTPCHLCYPSAAAQGPRNRLWSEHSTASSLWGGPLPSLSVLKLSQYSKMLALGESWVFIPSLSLNAHGPTISPPGASKDGYGEHQNYKFQPTCSELGENGKTRGKAKGLLVHRSINFLYPPFKQQAECVTYVSLFNPQGSPERRLSPL